MVVGFIRSGFMVAVDDMMQAFGPHMQELYEMLTLRTEQKVGEAKTAVMYERVRMNGKLYLVLPRVTGIHLQDSGIITALHVLFAPVKVIEPRLTADLYYHQELVVGHLLGGSFSPERIAAGSACAILDMEAGLGKTAVAAALIHNLGLRTLFIVPKRPLMLQIVKELTVFLKGITVAAHGSRAAARAPPDVLVIVINSALNRPREWFDGFSFVIYDEVHEYCSEQRRAIFRKSMTHVNLGMSATTGSRGDGFDPIAHNELAVGGIVFADKLEDWEDNAAQFDTRINIVKYNGPDEYTQCLSHPTTGKLFMPYMNRQFVSDPYRTKLVLRYLHELYDWEGPLGQKHCIYVFCENLKPLDDLFVAMKTAFGVYAPELVDTTRGFVGGTKDRDLVDIQRDARILLTTYGYGGTGISINKMTAIVMLTPRKAKMQQIINRIRRLQSDISIPRIIVDFVDNRTPIRAQLNTRLLTYQTERYHAKIRYVTINYDSV